MTQEKYSKSEREVPSMTLVRSSRGRYMIGLQGFEVETTVGNIRRDIHHDMVDAAMEMGREQYSLNRRIPGKIKVSLKGRAYSNRPNNFEVKLD